MTRKLVAEYTIETKSELVSALGLNDPKSIKLIRNVLIELVIEFKKLVYNNQT